MKNILFLPLDERPCNYDFPRMIVEGTGYSLLMPPREILGKKKKAGDTEAIWKWLLTNITACDDAVISIDTLLYSGIVPSRLHNDKAEYLLNKLKGIKELKKKNPNLTLYAFNLIMRNPTYSSAEEEPDYYGEWGKEIYLYGSVSHRKELGIATDKELHQLEEIKGRLPENYLNDYLNRRATNIQVNKAVVKMAAEGVFDFVIFPQDDSSPFGFTAKDQQVVRSLIDSLHVNLRVYMYPDADAVANTLIARTINRKEHRRPLVYVKYASTMGHSVIPLYEDRIVGETIKYQILAAGGLVASSAAESQIVLMVNVPSGKMQDTLQPYKDGMTIRHTLEYDANRNPVELVEYADYAIGALGKDVIFADIAYCNGGDPLLLNLLKQKGLLWKLAGYAGWNTSSNSLGTCIPMGMIYSIFGNTDAHRNFLALRYVEDIGYCSVVRQDVSEKDLPAMSLTYYKIDGPRGKVNGIVREKLQKFADENLSDGNFTVKVPDCYMPWNRMFEAGIRVNVSAT